MDENRITGASKELGGKVQGKVGAAIGDRETQGKGKMTELKGSTENLVGQAKDAVRDVADQANDLAGEAIKKGRERFPEAEHAYRQGGEALSQYAKESPLIVVAMAGALGYLLALVIHGRK
ncbi:CsbD family protein [Methylobacterium sp. J-026]|uniref:CsbD family protein n=1 Tax=Methylobacterium sp. J-026 TaxID=2836624 RepID=UPI001FBB9043|nr:CsbD family protein [Methylobacterium sp. J-026]MCJ2137312.1 CsbD family protein [Methylobacterium sp. J-026]